MTKAMKASRGTELQALDTVVVTVRERLELLWSRMDGDVEAQAAIANAWSGVAQLNLARQQLEALLAGMLASAKELEAQRDSALYEVDLFKERGELIAERKLAGQIALDSGIPVTDVRRVLNVLFGHGGTKREWELHHLYEWMDELARALAEDALAEKYENET